MGTRKHIPYSESGCVSMPKSSSLDLNLASFVHLAVPRCRQPTTLPHSSVMPPRPVARRMTTRSSNANTRPGLVQVQANHQVARDRKERPAGDSEDTDASERRAAAVRRIADLEHDIMEEDTDDFLKAPPQKPTKKRQHRERSSSVVTGIEAEAPTPPPEGETDVEIDTPMPKRRGSKPKKIPFREAVRHFQEEDNLDATDVEKTPQHTVKSNAPKRLLRARESVRPQFFFIFNVINLWNPFSRRPKGHPLLRGGGRLGRLLSHRNPRPNEHQ